MKFAIRTVRVLFLIFLLFDILVFANIYIVSNNISNEYKITKGETLKIDSYLPITTEFEGAKESQVSDYKVGDNYKLDLKLFGVIPFSTVDVQVVDDLYVAVLGTPFGMKIYTEGVLVIELSDVDTANGPVNPAKSAGIRVGDYIETVNGKVITCNEDLSDIVLESNGEALRFEVLRDRKKIFINIKPEISLESGTYRIGLWVRDSSAGIGTLTFYNPSTNLVCGLGHGICDSDTGSILQLDSGQLVDAEIISVVKGDAGSPGELKGSFKYNVFADIELNCESGVYGLLNSNAEFSNYTEIALKQEIEDGAAQILCTVNGTEPKLYDCTVKKRTSNYLSKTQNFIITVTDKELLNKTGGIVQGMSGSPIIQNGKLIGAVTHVLVDDPTKGYAIFAENMLETAQLVSEQQLKEAS